MANSITSDNDYGDMREIVLVWDTGLTVDSNFTISSAVKLWDFSRYSHVSLLPIASVGTVAGSAYTFGFLSSAIDVATYAPITITAGVAGSVRATVGTGTPLAGTRAGGWVDFPVATLGLFIAGAGTGATSFTFRLVGYRNK